MKSISWKILKTTLLWLVIITFFLSVISVYVVSEISKKDSDELLTQICEKETYIFNDTFRLLESSVITVASYVLDLEGECTGEEELLTDEFCGKVQDMTLSIANRTDGAMAVYFRYNPELTGNGTAGFFWSRGGDDEKFAYCEPTDILKYEKNDIEHVGWFYEPMKKREAIWMTPYYNKNLDVFMISYIVPYYTQSGVFLGVIGMDIDFNKIVSLTGESNLYKTGRIEIIDLSTYLRYSAGDDNTVEKNNLSMSHYNHLTTIYKENKTLTVTGADGNRYKTCVSRLRNGMRLMLLVPVSEVNAQRDYMLMMFAVCVAASLICSVYFVVRLTRRIVDPLKKLTRITGQYSKGNWSDKFVSDTGDEIQELSESILIMAETTKSYIDRINYNAMTDTLTGLKNKNSYLSYITKYKESSISQAAEYAVVVFDVNFLKRANDEYGHETGDSLIRLAGQHICRAFPHSPVFRIGGDEYASILLGDDYSAREELCRQFEEGMKTMPPVAGDLYLSISYGVACHHTDGASYDEVFKCADERMYECKKRMKAERK